MLINSKFEGQTWAGNSTGNSRSHALAPRALNMSRSFGQSARSIENRCVAIDPTFAVCLKNTSIWVLSIGKHAIYCQKIHVNPKLGVDVACILHNNFHRN